MNPNPFDLFQVAGRAVETGRETKEQVVNEVGRSVAQAGMFG